MDIAILIIYAATLAVSILLIIKFWTMSEDVSKIREMMQQRNLQQTPPQFERIRSNKEELTKGDFIMLSGYGKCRYEGEMHGLHYFYPTTKENLRPSQFLTEGAEPYLAIPTSCLGQFINR